MRLNLAVIVGCLLLGLPVASFGAKFNQDDLFKTAPTSANASNAFANTVSGIKDAEKAAKAREYLPIANAKIAQDPNNDKYYLGRAQIYRDLKDFRNALSDINQAIKLKPSNAFYYGFRSSVLSKLDENSAALQDVNKAISLGAGNAESYLLRAAELQLLTKYRESLADANRSIELDSSAAITYAIRGVDKYHLKDFVGAEADCQRAESIDPGNVEVTKELRQLLSRSK